MSQSLLRKNWRYLTPSPELAEEIAGQARIPVAIAALLLANGITRVGQVQDFFQAGLQQLPQPFLFKGMECAVDLIINGLKRKAPFVIYGDYDVDGVTAAAVLSIFLKEVGARVKTILPNRMTHGYGLNRELLVNLATEVGEETEGAVLITVDCGISNIDEIAFARELGFVCIVTDHHRLPAKLPEADAIINPLQEGCAFPDKHLAGVGLAFYMAAALRSALRKNGMFSNRKEPNLKNYLDLVAIGTVCDMVPLTGVNRVFVRAGSEVMGQVNRPGLRGLLRVAKMDTGSTVSSENIAFRLGPRINAAGRLDDAGQALALLTAGSEAEGTKLAAALDAMNEDRKNITEEIYVRCCHQAEQRRQEFDSSLVLMEKDWHQGVLGIVASKLVQRFMLPTVLVTEAKTEASTCFLKGSARSVPGFDLFAALQRCADLLERFGGHKMAAGLTIREENYDAFSKRFNDIARTYMSSGDDDRALEVFPVSEVLQDAGEEFLQYYKLMEPFGVGNPEPVLVLHGCELRELQVVGNGHLRFAVYQNERCLFGGIGFNRGELKGTLLNKKIDLAFTLRLNRFRGVERWQATFVDYQEVATH